MPLTAISRSLRAQLSVRLLPASLAAAFILAGAGSRAQSGGGVDVDRLVQGIQAAEARIQSAKCTITVSAKNADIPLKDANGLAVPPMPENMVTIVATKGRKAYMETVSTSDDPPPSPHSALFYRYARRFINDGKQSYHNESPKNPASGQPTMWIPVSQAGAAGVKEWLYHVNLNKNVLDLLRNRQYTGVAASSSPAFGPVVTITFDPQKHLDTPEKSESIDLAPAYGYAIVRVRTDGLVTQEITKFTREAGVPLPSQARRTSYVYSKLYRVETITFTDLEINNVPDSLFAANIKPGDIWQDKGTRYIIGRNGARILQWSDHDRVNRKMPIGWLFIASLTTAVLLGLGALARRRRTVPIR